MAYRNGAGRTLDNRGEARGEREGKAQTADSPEASKTPPFSLGKTAFAEAISPASDSEAKSPPAKKPRKLEWQQVNAVTWRLVDPDARQLLVEASHGQWGGHHYPKALAYVFDVGLFDHDWRVRVRLRGNQWRAFGCIIDLQTAKTSHSKRSRTRPNRGQANSYSAQLDRWYRWPGLTPKLDRQTLSYIHDVETGAVKVDAPNEQPTSRRRRVNQPLCRREAEWLIGRLRGRVMTTSYEASPIKGNRATKAGSIKWA